MVRPRADTAGNSLHQTIYFLRRVFEPDYREGLSAGYVGFDGDVVSLDRDLIDTTSRRTWELLGQARTPDPGREPRTCFAPTRVATRSTSRMRSGPRLTEIRSTPLSCRSRKQRWKQASRAAISSWRFSVARSLLKVDPDADTIELLLLRAYKRSGRGAAAAEQYAHYATVLRRNWASSQPAYEDV